MRNFISLLKAIPRHRVEVQTPPPHMHHLIKQAGWFPPRTVQLLCVLTLLIKIGPDMITNAEWVQRSQRPGDWQRANQEPNLQKRLSSAKYFTYDYVLSAPSPLLLPQLLTSSVSPNDLISARSRPDEEAAVSSGDKPVVPPTEPVAATLHYPGTSGASPCIPLQPRRKKNKAALTKPKSHVV